MGRRSVPRAHSPVLAVLSMSAGDYTAVLVDISRTGARVRGEVLPQVGQQLTFKAENVRACADVVWRDASSCAVEFDTPIAVSEVQQIRSSSFGE